MLYGLVVSTIPSMSLFKSASLVSAMTMLSRITGYARDLVMVALFGSNAMTDAFYVAFRLPNLLRRVFAEGTFMQVFVPVFAATKEEQGVDATRVLLGTVTTVLFWVLLLVSVLGVVGAPVLVWLLASGFAGGGEAAAVNMTRIMFPYIGLISFVALSSGVLNTWGRFGVPAATPVLLNICMISATLLGVPYLREWGVEPIYALAIGVMIGGVAQLAVQIPALKQLDMLPHLAWRPSAIKQAFVSPDTKRIVKLMLPGLLGVSVAQISLLINTQIASYLEAGSVSWLSYSDRLMEFPTAMLGVALGVVLMPQLAAAKAAGEDDKYAEMIDWGLRVVLLLALPCMVALLVFAKPLAACLFFYGAFTERDVQQVALSATGYGVGLLGIVAVKVLASAYYAKQDMKAPVRIAIFVLIMVQLCNVMLVPLYQHAGLALSIGLGGLVNASLLLRGLIKDGTFTPTRAVWLPYIFKLLLVSVVLAVGLYWANTALPWLEWSVWQRLPVLLVVIAACAVVYFGLLHLLGVKLRAIMRH